VRKAKGVLETSAEL